jgi:hypothetical protein
VRAERSRPYAPGYGIPTDAKGLLPWSVVEERMIAAREYWVATVHPAGRPHLTPVWGLWVDGAFYFGSDPQTRKARDLAENPSVAVHPVGEDMLVLEGIAAVITDPTRRSPSESLRPPSLSTASAPVTSRAPTSCARASCSLGPRAGSRAPRHVGYSASFVLASTGPGSYGVPALLVVRVSQCRTLHKATLAAITCYNYFVIRVTNT